MSEKPVKKKAHNRMPPIEHRFKKGMPSRGGRPKDPPELKTLKNLTREELASIGKLVIAGDLAALRKIRKDPTQAVLRVMIASVAIRVIERGDMAALDTLLNRLVGKVKDELEVSSTNGPLIQLSMPSNGREAPALIGSPSIAVESRPLPDVPEVPDAGKN